MIERVKGSLLGGLLGDAYAGRFMHQEVVVGRDPWQLSGISMLNMALCDATVRHGSPDPSAIAASWAEGYRNGLIHPPDSALLKALVLLSSGESIHRTGQDDLPGDSNGAALFAAPLGFLLDPSHPADAKAFTEMVRTSHLGQEALDAAWAVAHSIRTAQQDDPQFLPRVARSLPDGRVKERLLQLVHEQETSLSAIARKYAPSREAAESVPLALYAAWRSATLGFEPVIRVMAGAGQGGNTWSSITGQVAGALLGVEALPKPWLRNLRSDRHFEDCQEVIQRFSAFVQNRQGIQTLF